MELINRYNKKQKIKEDTDIILDKLVKELHGFINKMGNSDISNKIDNDLYIDQFNDILEKYPQFDEDYTETYKFFMINLIGISASLYLIKNNEDTNVTLMNDKIIEAMSRNSNILARYNQAVYNSQQPIEVNVTNHISDEIKKYQNQNGATKVWIAMQMGYNSPQALDKAIKNASNSVETYAKFAYFLGCEIHDLYTVKIIKQNS